MTTMFDDVKPFPVRDPMEPAPRDHNRPPIEETILEDFAAELARESGLNERLAQLAERGSDPSPCVDDESAGRYADFIKMCGAATKMVEAKREILNRPILNAQRALKSKADALCDPVNQASTKVRARLNEYDAEKRRQEAAQRRAAEEEALRVREEAEKAAADAGEVAPIVTVEPAPTESAPVRGAFGSTVARTTQWKHELVSVRQLPDRLLNNAKVIEAISKVIAAEIRGGAREIKGVRIWSEQVVAVR